MHFRKEKSHRTLILVLVIIAEIAAAALECWAVFNIAWSQIIPRRCRAAVSCVSSLDTELITGGIERYYQKATEQRAVEMDETVWTTDYVNYRTGPGTGYERAGTLNAYAGVRRVGKTYNDWSEVIIDNSHYFILSELLTTEMPLITATGAKGDYQRYALSLLGDYGWDKSEIVPLIKLWDRESGWNPAAHNGSSGAHGIAQALPAAKMASEGADYYTNGNTQIRWGLKYISRTYGSPSNAWGHFTRTGWY